jgi:hypothetical protein
MAYTEILVHLDYTKACDDRTKAALSLAARSGARVRGVAFALESTISSYLGIQISAGLDKKQKKTIEKAAAKLIKSFEAMAAKAEVPCSSEIISCSATKAAARWLSMPGIQILQLWGNQTPMQRVRPSSSHYMKAFYSVQAVRFIWFLTMGSLRLNFEKL